MATQYQIKYHSGPYKVQNFKEAAGQTFKTGDMVVVTTDTGYIRICATGDEVLTGIALKDATGTTASEIPVMIIESGTLLMSSVYHATAASAITAVTQIGASYDPRYATTANYLDIGTQTDNIFTGQKHMTEDAIGTQYGRIIFTVKPTALTGCGIVLAS